MVRAGSAQPASPTTLAGTPATVVLRGGRDSLLLQEQPSGRELPLRHLRRFQPHRSPSLSWNGRYVAVLGQQGNRPIALIEDRASGKLQRLSLPGDQAVERLSDGGERFDVVLADLGVPDSAGIATLDALTQAAPSLPVVVLTGNDDDAIALEALKRGAQDYLVKGLGDAFILSRVVRYAIERHVHRIGMAAEIAARLEQADVMVTRQQPGRGKAGNAGADDGDFHDLFLA